MTVKSGVAVRDSQLRLFYLRVRGRRGHNIAIIAVAKKLLKIIWHLLMTGDDYVDKHYVKKTVLRSKKETIKLALEDAIPILRQAGYMITSPG